MRANLIAAITSRYPLSLATVAVLTSTNCGTGGERPTAPPVQELELAILVQPASSVESGTVMSPAVQVAIQDAHGKTSTSATPAISVALNSGVAVLGGTHTQVPVNGVASFGDLTIDRVGGYSLTVSAPFMKSVTSNTFAVVAGAPRSLAFTVQPPTIVVSGTAIAPAIVVTVLDVNSNVVSTASSSISVALTDGSGASSPALGGTRTRSAMSGVAAFDDLTVDTVGVSYTLRATSPTLTNGTSSTFRVLRPPTDFALATITVGLDQTCGLSPAGTAYCWGANGFGQLGDGSLADRAAPAPIAGGLTFTTLSAGGGGYEEDVSFTCGVTTAGDGYCWGGSFRGALGDGSTVASHRTPVPVSGGLKFRTISAGGAHACGLTTANVAYCWGSNDVGELGVGDRNMRSTPVPVLGNLRFTTITAGDFHTCATNPDATYCWGGLWGGGGYSVVPTAVSTSSSFGTISAATEHTCGLTVAGTAYCWGDNSTGQLGDGSGQSSSTPLAVSGGRMFGVISAKGYTSCGVSGGAGYCWGWNDLGQLGAGFVTPRSGQQQTTPLRVTGSLTFTTISVGVWHTCAVTATGVPYCWGLNSNGQLGNDTKMNSAVPVPVVP